MCQKQAGERVDLTGASINTWRPGKAAGRLSTSGGGGERENTRWDDRDVPPPQTHPSHKTPKSHSALQLYISLQGFLQLSASYSNPQLLPARNLTVRNLSARRLKPEECYCSGHSCTSTGLATAATVCVGREEGGVMVQEEEEGGRSRRCEKGNFTCFQCSAVSWQSST